LTPQLTGERPAFERTAIAAELEELQEFFTKKCGAEKTSKQMTLL
jgi:hypothetical protein